MSRHAHSARWTVRRAAAIAGCGALMFSLAEPGTVRSAAAPPGIRTQAPDGRRLILTFADEFDSFRPRIGERGVWRTRFGDGRVDDLDQRTIRKNGELQIYVDSGMRGATGRGDLNPFATSQGRLEITAARASPGAAALLGDYAYTSGLISSQPSFAQAYGYFEMRAALPAGKGLWPAFWLLPADQSWPPEIDVMESVGDPTTVYVTAHSSAVEAKGIQAHVAGPGFHTFAVAWDPSKLVWYVDGAEVGRQATPPDMTKPMYMVANLALGGAWAGTPDASTPFPARYAIDYIHAYRFAP